MISNEVKWNEMRWNENGISVNDMGWNNIERDEMRPNAMKLKKWYEIQWAWSYFCALKSLT